MRDQESVLNYVLYSPRGPITLDLFEAERYEAAVVVQQLVGTLVYYSNRGRYEPRLAKRWARLTPEKWQFELREGLTCENGEPISPQSFSESIVRILKIISSQNPVPILNKLKGYNEFVNGESRSLRGIHFDETSIYFEFTSPVRSGLVQMLSFATFGYICKENLSDDLTSWRNQESFISSGPYRAKEVKIGQEYVLERNPSWSAPYLENAPQVIRFTHNVPNAPQKGHWIVDSSRQDIPPPRWMTEYRLVPEYLNPILLGNLRKGYFSDPQRRLALAYAIDMNRDELPSQFGAHISSSSFYPNQQLTQSRRDSTSESLPLNKDPLIIEGKEPAEGTPAFYAWKVLKKTLEQKNLRFRFNNNETNVKMMTDQSFDIRLRGTSIGGEVEPWGIGLIFCSELGIKLPDPSGKICQLVEHYERDDIDLERFKAEFFRQVHDDAAILPISHFGVHLFFSDSIDLDSIIPAINIIRFDQLGLN